MNKITTMTIRPDAAMVYAGLRLRLRAQGLPQRLRAELQARASHLRKTLTPYELERVGKLLDQTVSL